MSSLRLCCVGAVLPTLSACSSNSLTASPTPETHTIMGTYTIAGWQCDSVADSAFATIPGVTITISDGQGNMPGSGKLAVRGLASPDPSACSFSFSVPNVPRAGNHAISAGSTVSPVTFSYEELSNSNWKVALMVGG